MTVRELRLCASHRALLFAPRRDSLSRGSMSIERSDRWPDDDRRIRLVFVLHGISPEGERATFMNVLAGEEAGPTIEHGWPSSHR
ncbi:hypothetical protein [Burkholderia vietnamiensis]|uniref:hypothetical protein n=1 Tax=Burkholderia vietnamiensis TaxID=60552 RepID=UPI0012D9AE6B|nr:hypothetical protein [Burkholderia vietnamiensis]